MPRYTRMVCAVCILLILGMSVFTWHYAFRIRELRLEPCPDENPDWVYFPVLDSRGNLSLPTSYMEQVDFPMYNVRMITPLDPVSLNVIWCSRPHLGANKIGFVFRLWPVKGEIDNSDIRVLWVDRAKIEKAVKEGVLPLPPIQELPRFPQRDLDFLANVARRLPEP